MSVLILLRSITTTHPHHTLCELSEHAGGDPPRSKLLGGSPPACRAYKRKLVSPQGLTSLLVPEKS